MDPNRIDLAGLPTTFAIIGVVTLIVLALRSSTQTFPQHADRNKDATPWMVRTEKPSEIYPIRKPINRPSNRW